MTRHLFTVDVEEYFQVAALSPYIPREQWPQCPQRVALGVERLLELLGAANARGTFFVLGSVAEWNPELIRRIAERGHEIASHGWSHRSVHALSRHELGDEAMRSRQLLADISGQPIHGFRAPNFSLSSEDGWAFDALLQAGYRYDSSVFPGRSASGNGAPARVHSIARESGQLVEIPLTSVRFGPLRIPSAGGAWFRLFPYALTQRALRQAAEQDAPGVFYIHPWELDPDQPRVRTNLRTRVRHYGGLKRVEQRLRRLLSEFEFTSIADWLDASTRAPVQGTATK